MLKRQKASISERFALLSCLCYCLFLEFVEAIRTKQGLVDELRQQQGLYDSRTIASDNLTSSFTCQTRAEPIDSSARSNHCHFRRLCLNASNQEWQLHLGNDYSPLYYNTKGQAQLEWPTEFLNIGHGLMAPFVTWKPTLIWDTVPSTFVWAEAKVAVYISFNYAAFHFGHAIYDNILPLANLLELFHMLGSNFQTVLGPVQAVNVSPSYSYDVVNKLLNASDPSIRLLQLISRRPAFSPEQILQQHPQAPGVCFQHVLAGTDGLHGTGQSMLMWNFRQAVMTQLGIKSPNSFRPTILVVHKDGRRRIENDEEIFQELRRQFSTEAAVEYLDAGDISNESLKTKVERMARTSVLITPPGGLAQQVVFLPKGATAVLPNILLDDLSSGPLDIPDYAHLEYVHVQRLPVTPRDYARTTDRPQCENSGVAGINPKMAHCNIRLEDLEPLIQIVKQALHAWRLDSEL